MHERTAKLIGLVGAVLKWFTRPRRTVDPIEEAALSRSRALVSRPDTGPVRSEVIDVLNTAISQCKRVRLSCWVKRSNSFKTWIVEPYGIVSGTNRYLAWRGIDDDKIRKFILPYILSAEVLSEPFVRDPTFSLGDYAASEHLMSGEEIEVELAVSPFMAERVKEFPLDSAQMIEEAGNGGCIVRFRTTVSDEICNLVFNWGDDLVILKPQILRDVYARKLTAQLESYIPECVTRTTGKKPRKAA